MTQSRLVLLSFAASLVACGGGDAVILGPGPTAQTAAAPTSTPPASSAGASHAPAKAASCATASCKKGEVCCVADDPSALEFCAAWSRPASEADIAARSIAACAGAAPPELRKSGAINYRVLECSDSGDCGADELCVLGAHASAGDVASCVKKKAAAGSREVCGRGTCRAARTACEKNDLLGLRTCEPTTTWQCGATSCKFPEVCCAGRTDSHCQILGCSKMEGPPWACSAQDHCGDGQVCCLVDLGHLGSQCAFGCRGEALAPTCTRDADCPEIMGKKSRCSVVTDSPIAGVKACQVP
jgi:hypothetical protein